MKNKQIVLARKYKTACGFEVVLYSLSGTGDDPVHGYYIDHEGKTIVSSWTIEGKFFIDTTKEHPLDLVEIKKTETIYIHVVRYLPKDCSKPTYVAYKRNKACRIKELRDILDLKKECELLEVIEKTYEV